MFCRRFALLAAALTVAAAGAQTSADTRFKALVEKIATGDDVDADLATRRLIESMVDPLADAVGSMEKRPIAEQVRLRAALSKIGAHLRIRLFRADLNDDDRRLFDVFFKQREELVERLFDDRFTERQAAVEQIPMEKNSAAGLLIAARVDDEDPAVAEVALEAAARLNDAVLARRLARYIRDAGETVASGYYDKIPRAIVDELAEIVLKAIEVLSRDEAGRYAPDVAVAVRAFSQRGWDVYQRARAVRRLGELGNPQTAPVLLAMVDAPDVAQMRSAGPASIIEQTLGDAALLGLLAMFRLPPADYGFITNPELRDFEGGFSDAKSRAESRRKFRAWYESNAPKPAAASAPATGARP